MSCGAEFERTSNRQKKCRKDCGRTSQQAHQVRTVTRELHDVAFVGVDGEGQPTSDGGHAYVLLTVGEDSLYHEDESPLGWEEIFQFLYGHFLLNQNAAYVGFFLGYDFTQWFRSLPETRAFMLLHKKGIEARQPRKGSKRFLPFPVHLGDWEFDILGMKRFRLRYGDDKPWMYVCDSGSFFQSSFLTAIDPKTWNEPIVSDEDYQTILEGKAARATARLGPDMIRYNQTENKVMADLMAHYNQGLTAAGIRLKKNQWFGPGQAAQTWLDLIGAPTGEVVRTITPEWGRDAARCAYYGGWFEIFAHGHVPGTSYEYDINSAYPAVIATLPCLLHGTWTQGEGELPPDPAPYTLVHVSATGADPYVGPLPHRTPTGSILRPSTTAGWYWWHEVQASARAGLIATMTVDEWVQYAPCACPSPLGPIARLYERRLQVGKNSPEGRALKLIYNSVYGKNAQSIGEPKYANAVYASLITAGCRTQILDAIASHPHGTRDLLMVATDGVYFRTPHPDLDIDKEKLGAWDEAAKENLTLFMPGVYWDDKTRATIRAGEAPSLKSRGISASDLARVVGDIDAQFDTLMIGDPWPRLEIPVDFHMVTATQAITRRDWPSAGTVLHDQTKSLSSDPFSKRASESLHPDGDILRTLPYEEGAQTESTPYDKAFGDELAEREGEEGATPDGENIQAVLARALKL